MHPSAVLLAIAIAALGCAHLNPSEAAYQAQIEAERCPCPAATPSDAWWHQEIAEREARIQRLHRQLRADEVRQDHDEQERLERELDFEEESLEQFRAATLRNHSPGMMAGGITLMAVGGVALIATVVVNVAARTPDFDSRAQDGVSVDEAAVASAVLVPVGVSGFAVGLPLLVVGKQKVVKPRASAGLWVGAGEAAVRGTF